MDSLTNLMGSRREKKEIFNTSPCTTPLFPTWRDKQRPEHHKSQLSLGSPQHLLRNTQESTWHRNKNAFTNPSVFTEEAEMQHFAQFKKSCSFSLVRPPESRSLSPAPSAWHQHGLSISNPDLAHTDCTNLVTIISFCPHYCPPVCYNLMELYGHKCNKQAFSSPKGK